MKPLLNAMLIFVATLPVVSLAQVPLRFDHTFKIDTAAPNMKVEGDAECLNSARTYIPSEQFVAKLATTISTCGTAQGVTSGNNATCTQPYIMGGLFDFETGKFSVSQDLKPSNDPQKRVLVKVRSGQIGVSKGSFEIRLVSIDVWRKWILHERKAAVEVPSLCSIAMPAQVTFR